jgi:hypothetical protein
MIEGLAACFAGLADPRQTSRCDHQLVDILAIAVCAQGSRMSLVGDDLEHVGVVPGGLLAPAA